MPRTFLKSILALSFSLLFAFISASSCGDKSGPKQPPGAPENLSVDQRDETSLTISWKEPAEKGKHSDGKTAVITNYVIYYTKGTNAALRFSDFYGSIGKNLNAKIIDLDKNQNYQLTVAAQNDAGIIGVASPRINSKTTSFGKSLNQQKDVALLVFLGEGNAEGVNDLTGSERLTTGLNNVYAFPRNQRTGSSSSINWIKFTTTDASSLGNAVDHKQTVLSEFAAEWQKAIDKGNRLPDLYVVSLAWSGQAIDTALTPNDRWSPSSASAEKLYHMTTNAFSRSIKNIKQNGKRVRVLPLFWMHGETDSKNQTAANNYYANLKNLFKTMDTVAGVDLSVVMVKLATNDDKDAGSHLYKNIVNQKMKQLADENPKRYFLIDPLDNPDASANPTANKTSQGIFNADALHYNSSAVKWISDHFLDEIFLNGYFGPALEP